MIDYCTTTTCARSRASLAKQVSPVSVVGLDTVMSASRGSPAIRVGLLGGRVDLTHPALAGARHRILGGEPGEKCRPADGTACDHETFVAGILSARRGSPAPAICPGCELVVHPIYHPGNENPPAAKPAAVARAILGVMNAGARIINLSLSFASTSLISYRELAEACEEACRRGVIVVAASGNQGRVGALPHFDHPWVIPAAACDAQGRLAACSNIGPSVGERGVMAPGVDIVSTVPGGGYARMSGTSFAVPFVVGTAALLWSLVPHATAAQVRHAILETATGLRRTILPRLLDAQKAWERLRKTARK